MDQQDRRQQQNEQVYAETAGYGADRHDWKGETFSGGSECNRQKRRCLFRCNRRSGSFIGSENQKIDGDCIRRSGHGSNPKIEIENFPVIVVVDADGNNLYETAIEQYRKE